MTYEEAERWVRQLGGKVEREEWASGAVEYAVHLPGRGPALYFLEDDCEDVDGAIAKSITEIRQAVERAGGG